MSLSPNAFPDVQSIITQASSSDFSHALGPKLGVGNELRIDTIPAPVRPLFIGGRKSRKAGKSRKSRKSRKAGKSRKSRKSRKAGKSRKSRKSRKAGKSRKARKSRKSRKAGKAGKAGKAYLKGGSGGSNNIDSAVYGFDPTINTEGGALATPMPFARSNACVV
jgi:hypothetical protein